MRTRRMDPLLNQVHHWVCIPGLGRLRWQLYGALLTASRNLIHRGDYDYVHEDYSKIKSID